MNKAQIRPQKTYTHHELASYSYAKLVMLAYDHCPPIYDSLPLKEQDLRNRLRDYFNPTPPESPFGTMSPQSTFYIERESDQAAWQYVQSGRARTIFIQAPRQMGKSSLIQRIAYQTKSSHVVAFVDFEKFSQTVLSNAEDFFIEFSGLISDALGLPDRIDDFWASKRRSNLVKCSNHLTQHVLASIQKPLILALDEVERLFTCPFRDDFFGMLRSWHNDHINMGKLTLLLSGSTEPALFITNHSQSPFNVAERIALKDFSREQVRALNQRHGELLTATETEALYNLLGGQPFLIMPLFIINEVICTVN